MGVVCGQDGLLVQVAKIGLDLASTGGFSRKNGEKFLQQCIYISIEDILGVCLFELFCEIRNIRKLSQRSTKNFRKFFNHTYENFFSYQTPWVGSIFPGCATPGLGYKSAKISPPPDTKTPDIYVSSELAYRSNI